MIHGVAAYAANLYLGLWLRDSTLRIVAALQKDAQGRDTDVSEVWITIGGKTSRRIGIRICMRWPVNATEAAYKMSTAFERLAEARRGQAARLYDQWRCEI